MAGTIDKNLTTALKTARGGKPMQFAFLLKGAEGKLLVEKRVPPKEIADTKKSTGATAVFKGRCIGEDGALVFEVVKEPPGTLLGQLKKRLKDDAGVTCPVVIRVNPNAEAEATESPPAAPPAPPLTPGTPDDLKAAWEKTLAEVEPAYNQLLRDQPDKAGALRAVMAFAQGKAQKEDFTGAIAALRKLAEQLGKLATGSGKPAAGKSVDIWRDAKDAVDVQLGQLYAKLKKTGLKVLVQMADEIEGVLANFRVGLMTALTEYDQAGGANKEAARAKALQVVKAYQTNVPQDKHVIAADTNPFGVPVTIRQTLGGALANLQTALAG